MKKVWIASILATLMLTVPINSVVGTSDIDKDCLECQPASRVELLKFKLLMIRLEVFINILSSKFSYIYKIVENDDEISNKLKTFQKMVNEYKHNLPWDENPIICTILWLNIFLITPVWVFFATLYEKYEDIPIFQIILLILKIFLDNVLLSLGNLYLKVFQCSDFPYNS